MRATCFLLLVCLSACSDDGEGPTPLADAAVGDASMTPNSGTDGAADATASETGACTFEGERSHPPSPDPQPHVASIAGVTYSSNPPSWGPHCGTTGAHRVYTAAAPLSRCQWLHNLEHGAVVLLYNCPNGCPEILAGLQRVYNNAPADPDCPRRRLILTPDPELDVPVAASTWGYTWKASCWSAEAEASLLKFIPAHWGTRGLAPEAFICPAQ